MSYPRPRIKTQLNRNMKYLLLIALSFIVTACIYQMPNDDHISTLPNTNNPSITREKGPSLLPGKG